MYELPLPGNNGHLRGRGGLSKPISLLEDNCCNNPVALCERRRSEADADRAEAPIAPLAQTFASASIVASRSARSRATRRKSR